MTTKKKLIRTNPDTGLPDWGTGRVVGWTWERTCHPSEAERTLLNLFLAGIEAYRAGNLTVAERMLWKEINGKAAWQLLSEGVEQLAHSLRADKPKPAPVAESNGFRLTPEEVRDAVEAKVKELGGSRPKMFKLNKGPLTEIAWQWEAGDWRAVEVNSERRGRWLERLPHYVPGHELGLSQDVSREDQDLNRVRADLERGLNDMEREAAEERTAIKADRFQPKRSSNGRLPGEDWLLRFDSASPISGKARKSKSPIGCELCLKPVAPSEEDWTAEYFTSSKTSGKRGHRRCYEIRRAKLENERINA